MKKPASRAVIFDMDGLLIDSEPLWVKAEIEVFGREGLVLTPEDCARTKGLRIDDVVTHWFGRPSPAIEAALVDRVVELVGAEGRAMPGAVAAVAAAKAAGLPTAIASSSPERLIRAALGRLQLAFDVVRSAVQEPYGKPHPGIFLTAATALGVSPLACIVFEDSLTGVIAAKAARMTCIAVPEHPDPRFALADRVLASLDEVDASFFQ